MRTLNFQPTLPAVPTPARSRFGGVPHSPTPSFPRSPAPERSPFVSLSRPSGASVRNSCLGFPFRFRLLKRRRCWPCHTRHHHTRHRHCHTLPLLPPLVLPFHERLMVSRESNGQSRGLAAWRFGAQPGAGPRRSVVLVATPRGFGNTSCPKSVASRDSGECEGPPEAREASGGVLRRWSRLRTGSGDLA